MNSGQLLGGWLKFLEGHNHNYYTRIDDVMTSVQRRRSIDVEIMVFGRNSNMKEAPEPILIDGSHSN